MFHRTARVLEHVRLAERTYRVRLHDAMREARQAVWRWRKQKAVENVLMQLTEIARQTLEVVRELKRSVKIPLAVKLSSGYTSMSNFVWELDQTGVDGVVLFNRFYQPDIDVKELSVARTIHLSDSSELLPRLHWMAILSGRVRTSLAVTGGVHTAVDIVKSTMAGAHATQMVSALLAHGPIYLKRVLSDLLAWMEEHEWDSLTDMRGNMSLLKVPDPAAYERANYMMMLQSWRSAYSQGR